MFTPEAIAGYIGTGIWTIINLLVIYWFLQRFLFRPFSEVIAKRKAQIEADLQHAADKSREAEAHEASSRKQLADSMKQAADIVNTARQKALAQEAGILKEASEEAKGILDRTSEECKRMRSNMYVDMRREIADLAVAIASKVVGSAMTPESQEAMVDRFLQEEIETQAGRQQQAVGEGGEA